MAGAESGIPVFVPSCGEDGGYKQIQCHQGEQTIALLTPLPYNILRYPIYRIKSYSEISKHLMEKRQD